MLIIENVPITIVETGEKVLAAIEVHEVFNQWTVLKIIPQGLLDYTYSLDPAIKYRIQIGKHNIYAYCTSVDFHSAGFIQSDPSFFSMEAWKYILKNEVDKSHTVKDTAVEEKLLKELNKYFKSDECTISYKDANKIEEIIANVLNGE